MFVKRQHLTLHCAHFPSSHVCANEKGPVLSLHCLVASPPSHLGSRYHLSSSSSCSFISSTFHCMEVHNFHNKILIKRHTWYEQINRKWLHTVFRRVLGYFLMVDFLESCRGWWRSGNGVARFWFLSSTKTVSNFIITVVSKGTHVPGCWIPCGYYSSHSMC